MKKVEELEAELVVVSGKNKADIIAFAKMLIEEYGILLVLDANAELVKSKEAFEALNTNFALLKEEKNEMALEVHKVDNTRITISGQLDAANELITKLKEELEEARELATEAINKSNEVAASAPKAKTIKIGGKVYKINHGVNFNGKNYSADDLTSDKETAEKLIEMQSSAIELNKEDK